VGSFDGIDASKSSVVINNSKSTCSSLQQQIIENQLSIMSSLRLALKQSLQEAGGGLPEKRKQKKRPPPSHSSEGAGTASSAPPKPPRRKRRPGDPPRKRGRPRKHPLPEDVVQHQLHQQQQQNHHAKDDNNNAHHQNQHHRVNRHDDHHNESAKESSDEENEFSDSMASMDHDNDGEEREHEDDAMDDDHDEAEHHQKHDHHSDQQQHQQQQQSRERASEPGDGEDDEEIRMARKKRKKLLKKMKRNSAANTIQNHWKNKKKTTESSKTFTNNGRPVSPKPPRKQQQAEVEETENATPSATTSAATTLVPKPKKAVNKTVPPPAGEIIDWIGGMSVKKQRRNMSAGLRVKVRFATKVKKRDGKIVRKHKWYGGLVTAMSSGGSKIRIKYDDTTSEVAKYPDKDIIVDDADNDLHQAVAAAFIPPVVDESEDDASMDLVDSSPERQKKPNKMPPDTPKPLADEIPDDWRAPLLKPRADTPQREHEHEMTDDTGDGNVSEGAMMPEENYAKAAVVRAKSPTDDLPEERSQSTNVAVAATEDADPKDGEGSRPLSTPKPKNVAKRERAISYSSSDSKPHATETRDKIMADADAHDDDDDDDSSDDDGPMEIIAQGTGGEIPPPVVQEDSDVVEGAAVINAMNDTVVPAEEQQRRESREDTEESIAAEDEPVQAVGDEDKNEPVADPVEGTYIEEKPIREDVSAIKEEEVNLQSEQDDDKAEMSIPIAEEEEDIEDVVVDAVRETKKVKEQEDEFIPSEEVLEDVTKTQKRKREEKSPKPSRSSTPVPKQARRESSPALSEFKDDVPDAKVAKPVSMVAKSMSVDPTTPQDEESMKLESPQILSSEHSAFDKSDKPLQKEKKPKSSQQSSSEDLLALTTSLDKTDLTSIQRTGRRAAQQANERIASRQELVIQETFTKPKKKKGEKLERRASGVTGGKDRKRKEPDGGIDVADDDNQWVQCDTCSKWRVLPSTVDVDKLPNQWYCEMNIYDPLHNACDAAEQTPEEIAKAKRKAKRRQARRARLEAEAAAAAALTGEELEIPKEKEAKPARKVKSPMPPDAEKREAKTKKEEKRPEEGKKRASPATPSDEEGIISSESNSGSDQIKESKKARRSRSQEEKTEVVEDKKGKPRGRRRGKDKEGKGGKGSKGLEDNQEWVQCEKCEKWRRLPPQISADDLPDVWYCSMNTWDTTTNTCGATEDKADPNTVNVSGFGGHGGHKLSYRSLIFGTGKKQNRPISERTRAAESLFSSHSYGDADAMGSHPRVMYANSSMFVNRSNAARAAEERGSDKVSFLDLMSHSNLWAELRGLNKRLNEQGTDPCRQNSARGSNMSYSSLSDNLKREMKELVFHALGNSTMASHEVLLEAQCRPWEGVPKVWAELKATCTVESVVACLLELVSDTRVEVAPVLGSQLTVLDVIPKFRRVVKSPQVPQLQPEEGTMRPMKMSRCMKISKPWKHRMNLDV